MAKIKRKCKVCGKDFLVYDKRTRGRKSAKNRRRPKYCVTCSHDCSVKYTRNIDKYKKKDMDVEFGYY